MFRTVSKTWAIGACSPSMDANIRPRTARGWCRCSSSARARPASRNTSPTRNPGAGVFSTPSSRTSADRAPATSVLEVGCSFGHLTEYLAEQPLVRDIATFDTDPAFAAMVRVKVEELGLDRVRHVHLLSNEETQHLPYPDAAFDLVLVVGVVEHLPVRGRRQIVDEYYRVLAPGGYIAILDTPNRLFPLETHSVGLPFVQWMPARAAYRYARLARAATFRDVTFEEFTSDGTGWRNASFGECLPSEGAHGVDDVTETAGYGWRFFRDTARSRSRRALLPMFGAMTSVLRTAGRSPSLCLPYFNLLFRKR